MKKKAENVLWLLETKFLKIAFLGTVITVIAVYLITMPALIKPVYESEAIVYAPLTVLSQQLNQQGIGFANDKEVDWYIQILKSNHLADSLDNRFHLLRSFGIDTISPGTKNRLYGELESRISIEKTRYGSVSIKVRNGNPQTAADMANTIIDLGEIVKKNMLYPNRLEAMNYAKSLFEQRASEIANLQKKLDSLQKPYPSQEILYNKVLAMYNLELQEFVLRKDLYEHEKKEFETPLPKAYIISSAVPASKAVWPNRKLLSLLGAGIFLFLLIVIEIIKRDIRSEG
jgi:uncharacterized protein involved in exopolysaccharide biosynthesis